LNIESSDRSEQQKQPEALKNGRNSDVTITNSPGFMMAKNQNGDKTINNYGETYPKWSFGGTKSIFKGSTCIAVMGPVKEKEYNQMVKLQNEGKYAALFSLCKQQIEEAPEWLTPYLFLGVAQEHMGLKEEAIKNFEHVIQNCNRTTLDPSNPAYQQAARLLKNA
jgi:tetratricopeptide (TPR) repeat protein